MKSKRQSFGKRKGQRGDVRAGKVSARVVMLFVLVSLVLGAIAISMNVKLAEREGAVSHSPAQR